MIAFCSCGEGCKGDAMQRLEWSRGMVRAGDIGVLAKIVDLGRARICVSCWDVAEGGFRGVLSYR